jgi:hypothetical protein
MLPQHYGRSGGLWRCSEYQSDFEECLRNVRATPSECWIARQKLGCCMRGRDPSFYDQHTQEYKDKVAIQAYQQQLEIEERALKGEQVQQQDKHHH